MMLNSIDCKQAETAMLRHMERSITAAESVELLKHVKTCERCMEEYLMFDQVVEFISTNDISTLESAPENFTQNVMASIRKDSAHAPQLKEIVRNGNLLSHLLGGSSLIVLAVALIIFYNPEQVAHFAYTYPAIGTIVSVASNVWAALAGAMNSIVYSVGNLSIESSISIAALAFVLISGLLLVVLQRQEERTTA